MSFNFRRGSVQAIKEPDSDPDWSNPRRKFWADWSCDKPRYLASILVNSRVEFWHAPSQFYWCHSTSDEAQFVTWGNMSRNYIACIFKFQRLFLDHFAPVKTSYSWSALYSTTTQQDQRFFDLHKVEKILKGSQDSISSPSRSPKHLNFLFLFFSAKQVCWQRPAMFCPYTPSQLSRA